MGKCDEVLTMRLGTVNQPGFRQLIKAGDAYPKMLCHKYIISFPLSHPTFSVYHGLRGTQLMS